VSGKGLINRSALGRHLAGGALAFALVAPQFGWADDDALVPMNVLSPELATEIALASRAACRAQGYQVAVAVVDRMGVPQVMLRDRFAGPHTPDTAQRMAWTAVSFRTDTLELSKASQGESGQWAARMIDNALMLGGGVPVQAGGFTVAGVGVSGTPSGEANDGCARAGIDAVKAKLELAD
jgi:uncharacterized protein GlcG (DUF336 family)